MNEIDNMNSSLTKGDILSDWISLLIIGPLFKYAAQHSTKLKGSCFQKIRRNPLFMTCKLVLAYMMIFVQLKH